MKNDIEKLKSDLEILQEDIRLTTNRLVNDHHGMSLQEVKKLKDKIEAYVAAVKEINYEISSSGKQ